MANSGILLSLAAAAFAGLLSGVMTWAMRPLLLQRLARIALDQGNAGLAAQLMGCAKATQDGTGLPTIPIERARWETQGADEACIHQALVFNGRTFRRLPARPVRGFGLVEPLAVRRHG